MAKLRTANKTVGEPVVWFTSMGLTFGLLMVTWLLVLIVINGLHVFWPQRVAEIKLASGSQGSVSGSRVVAGVILEQQQKLSSANRWEWKLFLANKDVYGLAFKFVDSADIQEVTYPSDILRIERMENGDAIGIPVALQLKGEDKITAGNSRFAQALEDRVSDAADRRSQIREIEKFKIGKINHEMEELQIRRRLMEQTSNRSELNKISDRMKALQLDYELLAGKARDLREKQEEDELVYRLVTGEEQSLPLGHVVSYYYPNKLTPFQKLGLFFQKAWAFLSDDPREANTEGGIFPAIFGTLTMTLMLSVAVTPFGVLAAIYLREYAKQGLFVRAVRIAVNNLAGVPSIVFGVFGLGFLVYFVGGAIDRLFYSKYLPTPTFGTGGILWASLTLALMTVPVVIVATEEALASVPRGVREGSLACGASKWQTILRVVLPASAPGILTGLILAMARGAGEVAPLMMVGVVKLAPSLPIDSIYPFVHLDQKFMHLGFHIYDLGFQSPDSEAARPMVFATTFFLILLVVLLNLGAIWIRERLRRKYATGAF